MGKFKPKHSYCKHGTPILKNKSQLLVFMLIVTICIISMAVLTFYKRTIFSSLQISNIHNETQFLIPQETFETTTVVEEDKNTYSSYFVVVSQTLRDIHSKLYDECNLQSPIKFKKVLWLFLESLSSKVPEALQYLTTQRKILVDVIKEAADLGVTRAIFYRILLRYFGLVKTIINILEIKFPELSGKWRDHVLKFSTQQILLKPNLRLILLMTEIYNLEEHGNDIASNVEQAIFDAFKFVTTNMFDEINLRIDMDDNLKGIKVNYLVTSVERCRRFFILNICFVYLYLFKIADNYEIIGLKEDIYDVLTDIKGYKIKNQKNGDKSRWDNLLVKNCRFALKGIVSINCKSFQEFFFEFKNINKSCLDELGFLIQTSLNL